MPEISASRVGSVLVKTEVGCCVVEAGRAEEEEGVAVSRTGVGGSLSVSAEKGVLCRELERRFEVLLLLLALGAALFFIVGAMLYQQNTCAPIIQHIVS